MTSVDTPEETDYGIAAVTDGHCHYWEDGPEDGPCILLIHGATVPAWEFDRLVPFLTREGYRVLRVDLFGHGGSDRPRTRYDYDLFARQIIDFLDLFELRDRVHVVGHSLGSAIAATVACRIPDQIGKLVLAAPLVDFTGDRAMMKLVRAPVLGEILMPSLVIPLLIRRRTKRYRNIEDGRFVGKFKEQLQVPGFGRALLSLFRSGTLGDQGDRYRALANEAHDVLILRGSDDNIVTREQVDQLLELHPRARHEEIDGVPHAFLLTDPERVAPHILSFLAQA